LAIILGAQTVAAQEEIRTIAGRSVVVWRPKATQSASERGPVIIFSHGFGGCATQSRFLTEALADHGYWVFAPNHKDARCGQRGGAARPEEPLRNPEKWSDRTYVDRADDVRAVLDAIGKEPDLATRVDLTGIGLVGHSLGGYTVVGLAGAWPAWKMSGIKAVLALSPYAQPFLAHGTLGGLAAAVMYQGGTLDLGITPSLRKARGVYDSSPKPKYFVEFSGVGHFAWTNLRATMHDRILDYSIAFLDHYIRGLPASDLLTKPISGVSGLRYDSELGAGQTSRR